MTTTVSATVMQTPEPDRLDVLRLEDGQVRSGAVGDGPLDELELDDRASLEPIVGAAVGEDERGAVRCVETGDGLE